MKFDPRNQSLYFLDGLFSGFFGLGSSLINYASSKENTIGTNEANKEMTESTNEMNLQIARETNELNKSVADQNLAFQRENLDYQKSLQNQIFEREDTAYQRTASDMAKAGLNPLTMNGTNGAGEAIATSPQENTMQYDRGADMIPPQYEKFVSQVRGLEMLGQGLGSIIDMPYQMQMREAEVRKATAEAESAEADVDKKLFDLGQDKKYHPGNFLYDDDGKPISFSSSNFDIKKVNWGDPRNQKWLDNYMTNRDRFYDMRHHLYTSSTDLERQITGFQNILSNGDQTIKDVVKGLQDMYNALQFSKPLETFKNEGFSGFKEGVKDKAKSVYDWFRR